MNFNMRISVLRTVPRLGSVRRKLFTYDNYTRIERKIEGHFTAMPTDCLSIRDSPNGGYLMNIAIKAALNLLGVPDPITVTGYYFNKTAENKILDINVELLSRSKSTASALITFSQDGVLKSKYLGTFGTLANFKGFSKNNKVAPKLPPVVECLDAMKFLRKFLGKNMTIANEVELRLPSDNAFAQSLLHNKTVDSAHLMGWCSFESKRNPCVSSLSFMCDAFPPPVLGLQMFEWVPTLEYTVHFWNNPSVSKNGDTYVNHLDKIPSGHLDYERHWLRYTCETTFVQNGMLYADNELWSADGKYLLATSRQLASVRNPINR